MRTPTQREIRKALKAGFYPVPPHMMVRIINLLFPERAKAAALVALSREDLLKWDAGQAEYNREFLARVDAKFSGRDPMGFLLAMGEEMATEYLRAVEG